MDSQQEDLKAQASERKQAKANLETYILELGKAKQSTSRIAALTGKSAGTVLAILKRYGLR